MKMTIYTLLMSILITSFAFAQQPIGQKAAQRLERLEAARVAFFTQRINLSVEEAQVFWPLFYSYQKEAEELIRQRIVAKRVASIDATSDEELDFKSRMVELQKRYSKQFLKALPKQKAVQVFRTEREFREKLIKELGDRRRNMPVRPPAKAAFRSN